MRIINLVENTEGMAGCRAAHGLCFYIETERHRLLMDAGPSPVIVDNASTLGVDLRSVDIAVVSHGHYDHADGLPAFAALAPGARVYLRRGAEDSFWSASAGDGSLRYIGMDPAVPKLPGITWVDGDLAIDGELFLFGGITGRRCWPAGNRHLFRREGSIPVQDDFSHEQCLLVSSGGRRVLLSGCAHSGILNILDRCRKASGVIPDAVISGFHMMKRSGEYTAENLENIRETARALLTWPCLFYTCHCTGLTAYAIMQEIMGDRLRYVHCGETVVV